MREYIIAMRNRDNGVWVAYGIDGPQTFSKREDADNRICQMRQVDTYHATLFNRPLTFDGYIVVQTK